MVESPLSQEVIDSRYQLLGECDAFSSLHQTDLSVVASLPQIQTLHYQPGSRVFRIAKEPIHWFVVEQGLVEGSLIDLDTFRRVTQTFGRGAFLTGQAVINRDNPYQFTATVISPEGADLLVIPPESLYRESYWHPPVNLMTILIGHQIMSEAQKAQDEVTSGRAKKAMLAFIEESGHIPQSPATTTQLLLEAISEAGLRIEREVSQKELVALHLRPNRLDF